MQINAKEFPLFLKRGLGRFIAFQIQTKFKKAESLAKETNDERRKTFVVKA
jgi:hypothetical protein